MTQANVQESLKQFRQWVEEQNPILRSLATDEFLIRFLRVANFKLSSAKQRLVQFWKYRTENPQWFTNRDLVNDTAMQQLAENAYCLQLPKKTHDNHPIFLMRIGHYDAAHFTFNDATKYAFAVSDLVSAEPSAQVEGLIILLDMSEVVAHHVSQFTPDFARRYVDCWEKMYPVHLHQVHFYNYPDLFDPVHSLFCTFYYPGLDKKMFFHKKVNDPTASNTLHKYIDPALLPKEYGGQLGSIDKEMNQSFIQWAREQNHFLIELEFGGIDLTYISQLLNNIEKKSN